MEGGNLLNRGAKRRLCIGPIIIAAIATSLGVASPHTEPSSTAASAPSTIAVTTVDLNAFGIERLDSAKVVAPQACAKCHVQEAQVWERTPHFHTFEQLQRNPEAREIANRLGIRSIKRNDLCADCHYTRVASNGRDRAVAGVSCESCHGAARDWVTVHNDYGGPGASREAETDDHRQARRARSIELGMRNPSNVYLIARSCHGCHTVPDERLVNRGGHVAGSNDFELVAWSQGSLRHRFLSTGGAFNSTKDLNQLRIMYVAGLIAELEFATRATASATTTDRYGMASATRAASAALKLHSIYEKAGDEHLAKILNAFADAELRTNNAKQLLAIADVIQQEGIQFAGRGTGENLSCVDSQLPHDSEYR